MKAAVLLAALSVLAVTRSAVITGPNLRYNLNVGYITSGDRLLHRSYLYQPGIVNAIQYQDFIFRGNITNRISAIQANEVGYTQYALPTIISGGLGQNNVTIRVQSARGYGFYYLIDIWGR